MPRKRFRTEHIVTTLRQAEVELGRGLHVQVVRTSADRWFRSPICTRRRACGGVFQAQLNRTSTRT